MKLYFRRILALTAAAWALAGTAPAGAREQVPFEQRQQMREQMREHWQHMPPGRREPYRQENQERWQQMPLPDRERLREQMREQRVEHGGRGGRW